MLLVMFTFKSHKALTPLVLPPLHSASLLLNGNPLKTFVLEYSALCKSLIWQKSSFF